MATAKFVDESKILLRLSDLTSEPRRMLTPIQGFETKPLVTLEKAVESLSSIIPQVNHMVWTVKQNCQNPKNDLTQDESASIMLYTLEWIPHENSFYFILNKTLRSQNRQELIPWFHYLRLFINALAKLPSTTQQMMYRGIKCDLSDDFPQGKTVIWWAFSSCTSSIHILEDFLGQNGARTIFNIESDSAKDITQHSFYTTEDEILLYPARQFQVISSLNTGTQLRIIHLKEIQPPFTLIPIPQSPILSYLLLTNSDYDEPFQFIIDKCQQHAVVNLSSQNLNDKDMDIVVQQAIINKRCKALQILDNQITSVGALIIANALNNNSTLRKLVLTNNRICDIGVYSVAHILSRNNSILREIHLSSNGITDEGVEHLAQMLKTNSTLTKLGLGKNDITDRGVQVLANALAYYNNTLKMLYLSFNTLVGDSSIDSLVHMVIYSESLKSLYISDCNLSPKGTEILKQTVQLMKNFYLDV